MESCGTGLDSDSVFTVGHCLPFMILVCANICPSVFYFCIFLRIKCVHFLSATGGVAFRGKVEAFSVRIIIGPNRDAFIAFFYRLPTEQIDNK